MVDDLDCSIVGLSTDDDEIRLPTRILGMTRQVPMSSLVRYDIFVRYFLGSLTTADCGNVLLRLSGTDTTAITADIEVDSDWAGPLNFTNCGKIGSKWTVSD